MLALLLVSLYSALLCFATPVVEHVCRFDEIHANAPPLLLLKELPRPNGASWMAHTASSATEWNWIRIRVSTHGLNKGTQHCTDASGKRGDIRDREINCGNKNVLTSENKKIISTITHSAIQMHATRLKVRPVSYGFKVPPFKSGFCSRVTVPDGHQRNGVTGVDMLLYVASAPTNDATLFAAAAPCAKLEDGRPLVGALMYGTSNIHSTAYHVRVVAHEIAHALGFSYDILKSIPSLKIGEKTVRNKNKVTEVRGVKTVESAKQHYGCAEATGMELEDEEGHLQTPSHSHWERRNARDELMAGIVGRGYYTIFTLSLFHDTGLYHAEFETAEKMEWGAKANCDFLNKPCITARQTAFPTMFCTETSRTKLYCTLERRAMGLCSGVIESKEDVPDAYRYFETSKRSGSEYLLTDRCPIIQQQYNTGCMAKSQNTAPGFQSSDSWCLRATDEGKKHITGGHEGICASVSHNTETNQLHVASSNAQGSTVVKCAGNDKIKVQSPFPNVTVTCPAISEVALGTTAYDSVLLETEQDYSIDQVVEITTPLAPSGGAQQGGGAGTGAGSTSSRGEQVPTVPNTPHTTAQPTTGGVGGETRAGVGKPDGGTWAFVSTHAPLVYLAAAAIAWSL